MSTARERAVEAIASRRYRDGEWEASGQDVKRIRREDAEDAIAAIESAGLVIVSRDAAQEAKWAINEYHIYLTGRIETIDNKRKKEAVDDIRRELISEYVGRCKAAWFDLQAALEDTNGD